MTSPYKTSAEAAAYLRYDTVGGFLQAVKLRGIPHIIRGRRRLFLEADLIKAWSKPRAANLRDAAKRAS